MDRVTLALAFVGRRFHLPVFEFMAQICTAVQGAVSEAQSLLCAKADIGARSAQSASSKVVTVTVRCSHVSDPV